MLCLAPRHPGTEGCRWDEGDGRSAGTAMARQPWGQDSGRAVSASSRPAGAAVPEQQVTVCRGSAGHSRGREQSRGCSKLLAMACGGDRLRRTPSPACSGCGGDPHPSPPARAGQSTSAFLGAGSGPAAAARRGKALRGD